jgi:hypothetical protein
MLALSQYYIGDPCYAIEDSEWYEFIKKIPNDIGQYGVKFEWKTYPVTVYNSGLGGDGVVNVGGHSLGVDSGLICVMPASLCREDMSGGEIVECKHRPVFQTDADDYPNVVLTIDGETYYMTDGYEECDYCGVHYPEASLVTDADGYRTCYCEAAEDDEQ